MSSSSPVVSLAMKKYIHTDADDDPEKSGDISSSDPEKEVAFMLTKDAHVILFDSSSGKEICSRSVNPKESSAVSMYLLGKFHPYTNICSFFKATLINQFIYVMLVSKLEVGRWQF